MALRAQATALGIPPDKWDKVPALAVPWGTHATVRVAATLRLQGMTAGRAMAVAAGRLGLNDETITSRLKEFFRHSHGR